jgi:hypothetical protein
LIWLIMTACLRVIPPEDIASFTSLHTSKDNRALKPEEDTGQSHAR